MAHLCPDGCQAHVLFPVSSLEKLILGRYHASGLGTNRNQRHTHSTTLKRQVDRTNNTFINANIDESYYLDLPGEYKRQSDSGHTVGRHNKYVFDICIDTLQTGTLFVAVAIYVNDIDTK
ncbi:hypothetical protein BATDEDRAFT_28804 [Batrachochytrium dendrobatidis JAM81]|uniref:Uncharacterized protein n=1 Tax=Batrachochytrium dendrobatidis (strain JAM81 / FGSC 10211) TaxID=684364 RepID=F4PF70_BATDJ|nr:uncharacterized protein BATDEDRAFT_28804 [Batrachochytrium dendrobatidis JAM81]EGF76124.1 hypothetical protein BATDEDRAFT_28804 [Batrachochytrium dendrobatidis JAM81]|eukprot:XP_006683253.1 hypothetical protein BATDEDRAFT_28804 [Batrachochytrium dendrobatidis JAM81]